MLKNFTTIVFTGFDGCRHPRLDALLDRLEEGREGHGRVGLEAGGGVPGSDVPHPGDQRVSGNGRRQGLENFRRVFDAGFHFPANFFKICQIHFEFRKKSVSIGSIFLDKHFFKTDF